MLASFSANASPYWLRSGVKWQKLLQAPCVHDPSLKARNKRFSFPGVPTNSIIASYWCSDWVIVPLIWSTQTAITKYHGLGSLNNSHLLLMILEAGSPRSRCWHGHAWVRALFLACRWPLSHCVLIWQREGSTFCFSSCKDANLIGIPLAWPHLTLMTLPSKSSPTNSNTLEVRAPACEFEMGPGDFSSNTHCEPTAVLKGKKLCCEQPSSQGLGTFPWGEGWSQLYLNHTD